MIHEVSMDITFTFTNLPLTFVDSANLKLYSALSLFTLQHVIYAACFRNVFM